MNKKKHPFMSLISFDYVRFVWAVRSVLATLFCLLCANYFPDTGLWLITSSVFSLQLYAYGTRFSTKYIILILSLFLALSSATLAVFSHSLLVLWGTVVALVCISFYFSHQGTDRAMVGVWSTAIIIVSVFFPIDWHHWVGRVSPFLFGMIIAYLLLWVKIPRRKKDRVIIQLRNSFLPLQNYMEAIFNKVLFEEKSAKNHEDYEQMRETLLKLRRLPEMLECTYNVNYPAIKQTLERFYIFYINVFYWLVAIERFKVIFLPVKSKLSFEHLHTGFHSLSYLLLQALSVSALEKTDSTKLLKSIDYLLDEIESSTEEAHITIQQRTETSALYYVLRKLSTELKDFARFLEEPAACESILYLQNS